MILFYITGVLLISSILYTIYENKKNSLKMLIQKKQLEFGMNEIELKHKTYGKYGVAFSMISSMIIAPFAFTSDSCGDSVYCYNEDLFQVVEVSAGEYIVNSYGEGFSFGINVFIKNDSIVLLDGKYSYFEGFNKFHTVNDKAELISYNIDGGTYTEVTINDDYKEYIYVEIDDLSIKTRIFDYDFKDFVNDIEILNDLLEEYPPVIVREYLTNDDHWDLERVNDDYMQIDDEYYRDMYVMYFDSITSEARDWEKVDMRRIEINFIADGSVDDLGVISRFGTAYYSIDKVESIEQVNDMQYNAIFSNNPFWTKENEGQTSVGTSYNYLGGEVQKYPGRAYINVDKYEEYADVYSTIVFDLSNLDGEEPEIQVNGTIEGVVTHDVPTDDGYSKVIEEYSKTISISEYYIVDGLLVIPPVNVLTVYKDGGLDYIFMYDVTVNINGEVITIDTGTGSNVWFD